MTLGKVIKAVKTQTRWLEGSGQTTAQANHLAISNAVTELAGELVDAGVITVPATPKPPAAEPTSDVPIDTAGVTEWPDRPDAYNLPNALDEVAQRWAGENLPPVVDVFVGGDFGSMALGESGWTDANKYDPDWLGDSKLRIISYKEKKTIYTAEDNTLIVRPTSKWSGKVEFHNWRIQCGKRNLIDAGIYGTTQLIPCEVGFFDCDWIDGPEPCVRPGSFNQASVTAVRVNIKCPTALEHAFYLRNPHGDSLAYQVNIDGIGAQAWQEVSRRSEGPQMERATTRIIECDFTNFHKNPGRSSYCITLAGTGRDFYMADTRIEDLDLSDGLYGAFVSYNGGNKGYKLPSGKDNGRIEILGSEFNFGPGSRDLASFRDCEELIVRGCAWNSANGRPVKIENVSKYDWGNNTGDTDLFTSDGSMPVSKDRVTL